MAQGSNVTAARLQRKILVTAALAMLFVAITVAVAGVLLLNDRLADAEQRRLVLAARSRQLAVDQFLTRAQDVARQISSRSKARQQLRAYGEGRIDRGELQRTVAPILGDALRNAREVLGVARLDAEGRLAVAVGVPIPPEHWVVPAANTALRGPVPVEGMDRLVVGSAIVDREGRHVGTDVVLFDLAPLRSVVADNAGLGERGEALVAAVQGGTPRVLFPSRDDTLGPGRPTPPPLARLIRRAVDGGAGIEPIDGAAPSLVSFARAQEAPWAVLVRHDPDEVFAPVREELWNMAALIAALLVGGVAMMLLALRPLAGRVVLRVGELEQRVAAQTEALRQANDALELRVHARTEALEMVNRQLATFIYSASHNLRTPLRSIIGFVDIVLEDQATRLDDDSVELLRRVERSAHRMYGVLVSLLELSRLSAATVDRAPVDLAAVARERLAALRAVEPGRQVELRAPPKLMVDADPAHCGVLMAALIDNAWKFTRPRAEAVIELGTVAGSEPPQVFVRDNGVGFDARFAHKLFQPFHCLHRPDEFEGDGLGLAKVAQVVRLHGGVMHAESDGAGATFRVTLAPAVARRAPSAA